jgi:hypothetical protein
MKYFEKVDVVTKKGKEFNDNSYNPLPVGVNTYW